jgi:type IV pilus assembly protein PilY1
MTPSADPCAFGGQSFIMSMNLSSGARLNYPFFDTNGDGKVTNADTITIDGEVIPWSGISDPSDGVVKGVTPLYKWLCFAGSSGAAPQCIPVSGSQRFGRQSWREVRAQ